MGALLPPQREADRDEGAKASHDLARLGEDGLRHQRLSGAAATRDRGPQLAQLRLGL